MNLTYDEFIQNILNTRGRFECGKEYHERHHIIPRCMDGDNSLDNLIDLYAREHFIAHQLLVQENPENQKLVCAWWRMCNIDDKARETYQMTPEEYEKARINFAKTASLRMKGENNPNYGKSTWIKGKHLSEETKQKLSELHKGKTPSEDTRKKISEKHSGKVIPKETRTKMSESAKKSWTEERRNSYSGENNPMFGKSHTEEVREKLSIAAKNRPPMSEEARKKISKANSGENHPNYGNNLSKETRRKISESHKGERNPSAKQVVRLIDGKIYVCGKYAAEENQINYNTFKSKCRKCDEFMYYDEWITQQNDYKGDE